MNVLFYILKKLGLLLKGPDLIFFIADRAIEGKCAQENRDDPHSFCLVGLYSPFCLFFIIFIGLYHRNAQTLLAIEIYFILSILLSIIYYHTNEICIRNKMTSWCAKRLIYLSCSLCLPLGYSLLVLSFALGGDLVKVVWSVFIFCLAGCIVSVIDVLSIICYKIIKRHILVLQNEKIVEGLNNIRGVLYAIVLFIFVVSFAIYNITTNF